MIRDRGGWTLVLITLACLLSFVAAIIGLFFFSNWPVAKLFRTASGLSALTSFYQLKLSGWLEKTFQTYSDVKEYPFGPPSAIVRKIIDDPEHPTLAAIRNAFFFDPNTGAKFAVAAISIGILATWA